MTVYVLEIANASWEVHDVFRDKDEADRIGRKIIKAESNGYEHYLVTTYLLK